MKFFQRKFRVFPHWTVPPTAHRKNISSNQLFSNFFSKNVVFIHELFANKVWEWISVISTVCGRGLWKLRKFTRTTYLQKFRESNGFTKELLNSWFDEIFFSVRVNVSLILHCVQETGMVQSRRSLVNPII